MKVRTGLSGKRKRTNYAGQRTKMFRPQYMIHLNENVFMKPTTT